MKQKYLSEFPEIAAQFHPSKNEGIVLSSLKRGSNKKLWWRCEKGHEWQAIVNDRTQGKGCPACSGRIATKDNNLAVNRPDLLKEWHPSKNDLSPTEFLSSSGKKVWWQCDSGHEWEATIDHRSRGRGCPFCCGKLASNDHNLARAFPDIAKEWHIHKNSIAPDSIPPVSGKVFWWMCPNGHEYEMEVSARTSKGCGCPECRFRSLADERPEIAVEWHPTKNGSLKAADVSFGNALKAWWQCPKFETHAWKATIGNRTGGKNSGCPLCRASKGEKLIKQFLEEHSIIHTSQFTMDNCNFKKPLPFDFAIFSSNKMGLVEFHGEQHYRTIPYWGGEKKFAEVKRNDGIKNRFCKANDIPLLVVPYKKKSEIPVLLERFISQLSS